QAGPRQDHRGVGPRRIPSFKGACQEIDLCARPARKAGFQAKEVRTEPTLLPRLHTEQPVAVASALHAASMVARSALPRRRMRRRRESRKVLSKFATDL